MLRSAAKHTAFCFTPSAKQDDLVFTGTLQHLANPLRSFRTRSLIRSPCRWCPTKSYLSWHGGLTPENLKPGSQTRRNMLCWPLGIRSVLHCNDFPSYYACTRASSKARHFQLCWSQLSFNTLASLLCNMVCRYKTLPVMLVPMLCSTRRSASSYTQVFLSQPTTFPALSNFVCQYNAFTRRAIRR